MGSTENWLILKSYLKIRLKLPKFLLRTVFPYIVKLGYNELGYNEHSVITNGFSSQIGHFSTQINPVITNPGYN